jgi:hypothetical protein
MNSIAPFQQVSQQHLQDLFTSGLTPETINDGKPAKGKIAKYLLAEVIDQIDHTLRYYVALPKADLGVIIALWLAGTYCFNAFRTFGYLALRSATPRCGKTTLLRLLSALANGEPGIECVPTPAVLFREGTAVLLLDEVDRLKNADKEKYGEVLAVLNVGFERGGVVRRCERVNNTHVVMRYSVYSPKALSGIEGIADTLADRSFQIQMQRSATRTPRLSLRSTSELFEQLRAGLSAWIDAHRSQIDDTYNALPDALTCLSSFDDRFQDISEPLAVLATLADAGRPDGPAVLPRLLAGLRVAAGRRDPSSREKQLLAFLDLVDAQLNGDADMFIESSALVDLCREHDELSHIETTRRLAGFLKHFDLFPKARGGKVRGYDISREWVDEWRARYRA